MSTAMPSTSGSFLRALPAADKEELRKLQTLEELPKSRYATKLAVTAYPTSRRGRKAVFSHIEVYKMVENIAGRMREAGVRPGTVCAFALPTSLESIIYFYALMWIAAVAAPIDPTLPPAEFEAAARAVGAAIIVSPFVDDEDDELQQKATATAKSLDILDWHIHRTINEGVVLETHNQLMGTGAAWAGGAGDFKLDPEEIAVHIASGVAVVPLSHRALCAAAKSFVSTYDLGISISTMLAPPLHDIHGILILVSSFYSGGHIVLPGSDGFEASKFWELAKTHNITWVSASPDQILDLYETNEKLAEGVDDRQQLTFVRSCGEGRIVPEVLDKVEDSLKTPVYESYGTPEACGFATANRDGCSRTGTVGKPVDGVIVAAFDTDTHELCPPGTVGEIAVTGTSVADSYLNAEKATEAAVFQTEDADANIMTWFSTGDRGEVDSDGFITVHGSLRQLRAAELAAMEAREAEIAAAEEAETAEREAKEAEEAAVAKEEEEKKTAAAAAAATAAAATAAAAAAAKAKSDSEERERMVTARSAVLARAGVENPDDLDDETANAILARLEAIEANHRLLQADMEGRNAAELEEMRLRVLQAEEDADRVARGGVVGPVMVDVRMEELEAAVMAAAASAESSANNTREAVKAAREVADAAYGANRSQPVEVKASTGDQGALTKTVRVALDDVESAMRRHPAVHNAKAFGRKDKRFGAEVFCAILPKHGARVSEAWLKLHAQSVLPAPMVPKKFYYVNDLPEGISRRELSESPLLQDLSSFSGFTEIKHVKGPQWKPKSSTKRPVGA